MSELTTPWTQPQSVQSVLVTPMQEDLFTPDEALLLAGLNWTEDDPRRAMVPGWIKAAQQRAELDTGLALLTQIREVTFTVPAWNWMPLPAQCTPTQAIEELTPGLLVQPIVGPLPRFAVAPGTTGALRVTAGWLDKADLLARAPLLRHAVGLLVAHYATTGRDLAITGTIVATIPEGYEDAIAPFRLVWVM